MGMPRQFRVRFIDQQVIAQHRPAELMKIEVANYLALNHTFYGDPTSQTGTGTTVDSLGRINGESTVIFRNVNIAPQPEYLAGNDELDRLSFYINGLFLEKNAVVSVVNSGNDIVLVINNTLASLENNIDDQDLIAIKGPLQAVVIEGEDKFLAGDGLTGFNLYHTLSGSGAPADNPVQYLNFNELEGVTNPHPIYFESASVYNFAIIYREWVNSEEAGYGTEPRWGLIHTNDIVIPDPNFVGPIKGGGGVIPLGTPTSYDQLVEYNWGEAFGGTDPLNPVSDGFLDYLHIDNLALSQSYTEISTGSFDIYGEEHLMLYLDSRVTSSQSFGDVAGGSIYVNSPLWPSLDNYDPGKLHTVLAVAKRSFNVGDEIEITGSVPVMMDGFDLDNPWEGSLPTHEPVAAFNGLSSNGVLGAGTVDLVNGNDGKSLWRFENMNQCTVEFWANLKAGQDGGPVFMVRHPYVCAINLEKGSSLRISITLAKPDGTRTSHTFFIQNYIDNINEWNHYAIKIDALQGMVQVYTNGQEVPKSLRLIDKQIDTVNSTNLASYPTPTVRVGYAQTGVYFGGDLGIFRVYDRALGDNQIEALYNKERIRYTAKLCFDRPPFTNGSISSQGRRNTLSIDTTQQVNGQPVWTKQIIYASKSGPGGRDTWFVYWNGSNWIGKVFGGMSNDPEPTPASTTNLIFRFIGGSDINNVNGPYDMDPDYPVTNAPDGYQITVGIGSCSADGYYYPPSSGPIKTKTAIRKG